MKKRLGVILLSLIFFQTHANVVYSKPIKTNPECFPELMYLNSDSDFYLRTQYEDIFVKQGESILETHLDTQNYPYVGFTTNIKQSTNNNTDKSSYTFGDVDTNDTREIILSLTEGVEKGFFGLEFSHDSKLYFPKFYISEDNEVSYSQVLQSDMSDYSPTHIKIVFTSKNKESIREIIKIKQLQLLRTQNLWKIFTKDSSEKITIYGGNTCSEAEQWVNLLDEKIPENIITANFQENLAYSQYNTDTDQDGVKDLYDNCVDISNKDQLDINQNSVGDACEFDSDKDSIPNEIDNCRAISNPDQKDDDNDNIGNPCDNCNLYNPNQFDTDNNGVGDTCDQAKNYLEQNDDDGDNIINSQDNCRGVTNTNQVDSDNDGVGDACDNCKAFQNTDQADLNENGIGDICEDSDSDGVDTLKDNCPNIPNPDQADSDNDGIGNLCEDDDGDSIIFQNDNCPYKYNRDQRDTDGDTIGDVCDEKDDRFLESNKTVFIVLMALVTLLFLGGIFIVARKIQK